MREIKQDVNAADKKAAIVFHFKNSAEHPVIIKSVQPSCGCTTAALTREIYLPGETGELKVVFNFEDRVGPQEKTIRVETNDATTPSISLILQVNIKEPLSVSAHILRWTVGEVLSEKSIAIIPTESRKITAIKVQTDLPADVTALIEPPGADENST